MHPGLFEITLLVGSLVTASAGIFAALTRRRVAALLALNAIFAACFTYFFVQGLRFGGLVAFGLGALACTHLVVVSAMMSRARGTAPMA